MARVRLARLSESAFGRRDEAIEQLVDILGDDPENDEALAELERLYTLAERWEDLFELLDRKADIARSAGDLEAELALLIQLGSLSVERLSDSVRAIGMYERVLDQQPEHVAALEALGSKPAEAQKAAKAALAMLGPQAAVEELVRAALKGGK